MWLDGACIDWYPVSGLWQWAVHHLSPMADILSALADILSFLWLISHQPYSWYPVSPMADILYLQISGYCFLLISISSYILKISQSSDLLGLKVFISSIWYLSFPGLPLILSNLPHSGYIWLNGWSFRLAVHSCKWMGLSVEKLWGSHGEWCPKGSPRIKIRGLIWMVVGLKSSWPRCLPMLQAEQRVVHSKH